MRKIKFEIPVKIERVNNKKNVLIKATVDSRELVKLIKKPFEKAIFNVNIIGKKKVKLRRSTKLDGFVACHLEFNWQHFSTLHSTSSNALYNKGGIGGKKVDDWSAVDFLNHLALKFKEAYGIDSFEYKRFSGNRAKKIANIKQNLINKFLKMGYTRHDLKDYIDWIYDNKAKRVSVTLGVLKSDSFITEYLTKKHIKQNKTKTMRDLMK